jgi:DNA-binding LacI/PurR family transcriptional regulator
MWIQWDRDGLLRTAAARLKERDVHKTGVFWLDIGNPPQAQLERLEQMQSLVRESGLQTRPEWIIGAHQASNWAGYHAFNYLWDMPHRPDGLIIMDDVLGQGAAMAMLSRKIDAQELRIAVQGNEGSPIQFDPSWDCCQFSPAAASRMMVAQLRKRLTGQPAAAGAVMMPFTWRSAEAAHHRTVFAAVEDHLQERESLFRNGKELTAHSRRRGALLKV